MSTNDSQLAEALRTILSRNFMKIDSNATVFIRSLKNGDITSGLLNMKGEIHSEKDFGSDVDTAVEHFLTTCKKFRQD